MIAQKSIIALLVSVFVLSSGLGTILYKQNSSDAIEEMTFGKAAKSCEHHAKGDKIGDCDQHQEGEKSCCKVEVESIALEEIERQEETNSVLKTSSSFVSVIYVLVNYLFSNPLDTQAQSHPLIFGR